MSGSRALVVGIVDDHPVIPGSLTLLMREAGFVVLPPAPGVETVNFAESPDVVLCDLLLDGEAPGRVLSRGAAVAALVGRGWRVLSISGLARPYVVVEAIAEGAMGYLPKTVPTEAYAHAVRSVAERGYHMSATLAGHLVDDARRRPLDEGEFTATDLAVLRAVLRGDRPDEIAAGIGVTRAGLDDAMRGILDTARRRHHQHRITERQLHLLRLVGCLHLTNKQAARELGIMPDSVQWHLENIKTKYIASHPENGGVGPRAAAQLWAMELGLSDGRGGPQISGVSTVDDPHQT